MANDTKNITSAQIRAGRALLRMSGEEFAAKSLVSLATIRRAEMAEEEPQITAANAAAIRRALETAGVIFIPADSVGGPGVRLAK